jgi:hypothetical protein
MRGGLVSKLTIVAALLLCCLAMAPWRTRPRVLDGMTTEMPPAARGYEGTLWIVFTHYRRERQARLMVCELCAYLLQTYPRARFEILGVQQTGDAGRFNKGVSWNVALKWLRDEEGVRGDAALCLMDVDMVPRRNVDFTPPARGEAIIWWLNTGGVRTHLESALAVGGYPMIMAGWGREDHDFWVRMERSGVRIPQWPYLMREQRRRATVLNLEWTSEREEEALNRHYWGENAYVSVEMVSQENARDGLPPSRRLPAPERSWFDQRQVDRNVRMSDGIKRLSAERYRRYLKSDSMEMVSLAGVSADDGYFEQLCGKDLPRSPRLRVRNLTFDPLRALPYTPRLFLEDESLSWYFER